MQPRLGLLGQFWFRTLLTGRLDRQEGEGEECTTGFILLKEVLQNNLDLLQLSCLNQSHHTGNHTNRSWREIYQFHTDSTVWKIKCSREGDERDRQTLLNMKVAH